MSDARWCPVNNKIADFRIFEKWSVSYFRKEKRTHWSKNVIRLVSHFCFIVQDQKNAVDNWPKAANLLEAVKWWRFLCLRSSTHYYYLSCVWKIRDAKNGAILEFEALQKMQLFTMFENHWKKSYFQYCKRRNLNFRAKKINFEQELKWEIFADFETLCFFSKVQNR